MDKTVKGASPSGVSAGTGVPASPIATARGDQHRAPYAEAVERMALWIPPEGRAFAPDHHGRWESDDFDRILGPEWALHDLSTLTNSVYEDDTVLAAAEQLHAELCGARASRFLTTGASGANWAMVLCLLRTVGPGKTWLVQTNVHVSVWNALIWFGVKVKRVTPEFHPLGFPTVVAPDTLERAYRSVRNPGPFIGESTIYEGLAFLPELIHVAHKHGQLCAMDAAWHTPVPSWLLPVNPLHVGADLVSFSHKKMKSPGQGSILSLGWGRVKEDDFRIATKMFKTTSASTPILAGLDLGRRKLALDGARDVASILAVIGAASAPLRELGAYLNVADEIQRRKTATGGWNPTQVVFPMPDGYTGFEVGKLLKEEKRVYLKWNYRHLVGVFGLGPVAENAVRNVFNVVADVLRQLPARPPVPDLGLPPLSEDVLDLAGLISAESESVPLAEAEGRRSAYLVLSYPPGGLPFIAPGERVSRDMIDYQRALERVGAEMYGPPRSQMIAVLKRRRRWWSGWTAGVAGDRSRLT